MEGQSVTELLFCMEPPCSFLATKATGCMAMQKVGARKTVHGILLRQLVSQVSIDADQRYEQG